MVFHLSYKKIKINKRQRCFGCGREFPSGSNMILATRKDGNVFTVHYCMTCKYIANNERGYLYDFGEGDLYERAMEIEAEQALEEKE